jgi:hypothetical protein
MLALVALCSRAIIPSGSHLPRFLFAIGTCHVLILPSIVT